MSREVMKNRALAVLGVVVLGVVGYLTWRTVEAYRNQCTTVMAEQLLRDSEFLSQASTTKLVLAKEDWGLFPNAVAKHPEMKPFLDMGLVAVRAAGNIPFVGPIGAVFYLTPEGERASAGWQQRTGPEGEDAWVVPTATKELVEVQVPLKLSKTECESSFTWKWVPTDVGKAIGTPETTETSTVKLRRREQTDGEEKWFLEEGSIR